MLILNYLKTPSRLGIARSKHGSWCDTSLTPLCLQEYVGTVARLAMGRSSAEHLQESIKAILTLCGEE